MRGRAIPPENYHVTVAFLGAVPLGRVERVLEAVRRSAALLDPIVVQFERFGAFPTMRRPRVAWVGPAHRDARFAALCARVRTELGDAGFDVAPHDDAHVTIARFERDAGPLPLIAVPPFTLFVAALTVFASVTARGGARYSALGTFALASGLAGR